MRRIGIKPWGTADVVLEMEQLRENSAVKVKRESRSEFRIAFRSGCLAVAASCSETGFDFTSGSRYWSSTCHWPPTQSPNPDWGDRDTVTDM